MDGLLVPEGHGQELPLDGVAVVPLWMLLQLARDQCLNLTVNLQGERESKGGKSDSSKHGKSDFS